MKRIVIFFIIPIFMFGLVGCKKSEQSSIVVSEQDKQLAESMYEFLNTHSNEVVATSELTLTIVTLHDVDNSKYIELTYSNNPMRRSDNSSVLELGYSPSYIYEVNSDGIIDGKTKGSLGGLQGAKASTSWFIDDDKQKHVESLYSFAKVINSASENSSNN